MQEEKIRKIEEGIQDLRSKAEKVRQGIREELKSVLKDEKMRNLKEKIYDLKREAEHKEN